jgi:hypothetical protein
VRAAEPARNEHKCPDPDDGQIEKNAAHGRHPGSARLHAEAGARMAHGSESAVPTSRTVKVSDWLDEHSARCVAR